AGKDAKSFTDIREATALAGLIKDNLTTADAARKDALTSAQAMAFKALEALPGVLKANQPEKPSTDDAVKNLKDHAASYLKVAGAAGSPEAALEIAKKILGEQGAGGLSLSESAKLYESFHEKD